VSAFALEHFNLTLVDDERLLVVRKVLEGFDLCNLSQTHEQLSKESPLLQYWVAESPKKAVLHHLKGHRIDPVAFVVRIYRLPRRIGLLSLATSTQATSKTL
jgi:hypothetical protein